jgi:hypothetical protein
MLFNAIATLLVSMLCSFILGGLAAIWIGWRLIYSLVRQECWEEGYGKARAEINWERVHAEPVVIHLVTEEEEVASQESSGRPLHLVRRVQAPREDTGTDRS